MSLPARHREKLQPPATSPKRTPRAIILKVMSRASRYENDARVIPALAHANYIQHFKLLKTSSLKADVFEVAINRLINDGLVRVVDSEELAEMGVETSGAVYALAAGRQPIPFGQELTK